MKSNKQFKISGIYHQLIVKLIPKKKMAKLEGPDTLGIYEHVEGRIQLVEELTPEVKRHTLYHEASHHVLDTLKTIKNEEDKCDLLGAYLMKVADEGEMVKQLLSEKKK